MNNIFDRFDKKFNEEDYRLSFEYESNNLLMRGNAREDIKQFLKQELLEMMTKTIGEEKKPNESVLRIVGSDDLTDGYNIKRDNLIQVYRELYGDELVEEALEKLNK